MLDRNDMLVGCDVTSSKCDASPSEIHDSSQTIPSVAADAVNQLLEASLCLAEMSRWWL